jgi:tRNA A-37 threonylcarbamoyl transferase component Bud32
MYEQQAGHKRVHNRCVRSSPKGLSSPIAEGRTAEIYLWGDGHVLKLYRDWCPPDWVEYEARIARIVYEAGIPSPAVSEIVDVNGRRGLIYQRLEGITMVQDLKGRPWMLWKHAHSLAELQCKIHEKSTIGLPSYKDRLRTDIDETLYLPEALRRKAKDTLTQLPDDQNICHGDFHPENVLITKTGPVVIDWMTARSGSPWADLARTSLLLTIGVKAATRQIPLFLRMMVRLFHHAYLQRYHLLRADTKNEMRHWTTLIAAARLNENIVPEREALIKIVRDDFAE